MPITKAFVLEDDDYKVIAQKTREMGDASASAALRVIIREWHASKSNPPVAQAAAHQIQNHPTYYPTGLPTGG